MKVVLILISFAALAMFLAGCASAPPAINATTSPTTVVTTGTPSMTPPPTPTGPSLAVHSSPGKYTPAMSSTVGIGLYPDYFGPVPVDYAWETNYGRFLGWNQTTGKVIEYNESAVTAGQVYWSFPSGDMNRDKPPVTVRVDARDGTTGKQLANATVYIGWEDNTTAVVIPAPCGVTNCHGTNVACGQDIAEVCTMEYRLGDKCRSLAACRVFNGTCTVVEQPGYRVCVSCAEHCNQTSGGDPVKAFECESRC
jgi:hypothetical protein